MSRDTYYSAQFPAGEYYIGDLCYVCHPEWKELCNLMFPTPTDMQEGELTVQGKRLFLASTAYGDGYYNSNTGKFFGVDSGSLGIIAVKDIDPSELKHLTDGHVFNFDRDFTVTAEGGVFDFGNIHIDTAGSEEEEDDHDYYQDDYESNFEEDF